METLIREAKDRLERLRAELLRKHETHVDAERAISAEPEADWPDRAAGRNFEEVLHQQTHHEDEELHEVDAALSRIDRGAYGQCEDCGEPIPSARLVALPQARLCVPCAQKHASRSV